MNGITEAKFFRPAALGCGGFLANDWDDYWASLSDCERQSLRDKAAWEHMSLSAVAREWGAIEERA